MNRAVVYARFSSIEQAKGYSLERQLSHGREYVARMGWKLDREIVDEGRSAFHGTNRSEGAALHEFEQEARNGLHRDTTLCVENLDRLSRQGAKATAQLVWALNEQGVSIATWHDGYIYRPGNTDMMELFSVIIKAQLAHEESLKKSQRTKASWAKVHREISEGSKKIVPSRWPAWLEVHDDKYRPISERAALLNEIFELYANGTGIYRIVQMLNEREEPVWQFGKRRTGNGWYLPYVHRLLTNRGVIGEYVTLKGETLALDYYPQVVAPELFNRAQAVRDSRRKSGGRNHNRFANLMSGLAICAECGGTAGYEDKGSGTVTVKNAAGERRTYQRKAYKRLRCDANRRRHGCENGALFDYEVVEKAILDRVIALVIDEQAENPRLVALKTDLAEASRGLSDNKRRLANLIAALEEAPSSGALASRLVELEQKIEEQTSAADHLQRALDGELSRPSPKDDAEMIAKLRSDLNAGDSTIRYTTRAKVNLALRGLVEGILLMTDRTFALRTEFAVFHFDHEGNIIGGQVIGRSMARPSRLAFEAQSLAMK